MVETTRRVVHDAIDAIGELYRFDRFAAPAELWDDLQARFAGLLSAR